MTSEPITEYENLGPEDAARIDATCDRFEKAWKTAGAAVAGAAVAGAAVAGAAVAGAAGGDGTPRISDYLDGFGAGLRVILIRELVALDRACRERFGLPIHPHDYRELGALGDTAEPTEGPKAVGIRQLDGWPTLPGLKLVEVLGAGGMGLVFKARQAALNRDVAVKLLRDAHLAGPEQHERFHLEAQAIARLQHPHLVQVYEFGEVPSLGGTSSQPYLVMEYVPGGNLADVLAGVPQPPLEAAHLVETLARAIEHAHAHKIIHRDLKPGNVLMSFSGGPASVAPAGASGASRLRGAVPKISDFGLAKLQTGSDLTRTGDVLGTPGYMAPEQTTGKPGQITPALDVYGLGAILYEALTGRPPFRAETAAATVLQVQYEEPVPPRRLQPTVPRDLDTICLKCLQKEPGRRYAAAHDFAEDLRRFQEGQPISAQPASVAERLRKWVRRRPAVAALLAAVLLVAALGLTGIVWQWRQTVAALAQSQQAHAATRAHLYLNQIARARHELYANHVGRAERLLDETPEAARAWEWRYLKRQCQTSLFLLRGDGSTVLAVAYSPDGSLLASGSGEWYTGAGGELIIWDAQTGRLLRKMTPLPGTVYGLAFHHDGRRLAAACAGGGVKLWDVRTGELLRDYPGHSVTADCVAFSPNGRLIASGCRHGSVRVWEVERGKLVHTFTANKAPVWSVAFSPSGSQLVACDRNGKAHLWDVASGEVVRSFGGFVDFRAAAFSPDGVWLAFASYTGHIAIWDLTRPNSSPIDHHPNAGPLLSLVFTPNGSLAWSSREGNVRIQDLRSGKDRYVIRGHEGWAHAITVRPDGRRLASAGTDGNIRISDATAYEQPPSMVDDGATLPGLLFDENGRLLALGGVGRTTSVWDLASSKKMLAIQGPAAPSAITGSPDGRFWTWVAGDTLHVRERAATVDAWSRQLSSDLVTGLAYSADSHWLAWGGSDGNVHLLNSATGEEHRLLGPHGCAVTGVAFDPGGTMLASAGQDGTFCLWAIASGEMLARFGEPGQQDLPEQAHAKLPRAANVTRIAFSPDGRRLAAANPARPLEIWDVAAGRVAIVLDWDAEGTSSVAWSPDHNRLAAAFGKRVRVWDATEHSLETRRQATEGSAVAWHKNEIVWAEMRWDWFAVIYHAGKLIELEPAHAGHYIRRGANRAVQAEEGHGSWQDANSDLAKAMELEPSNVASWYRHALVTLAAADRERYRAICADMLTRFGDTDTAAIANTVAWSWTLDANSGVDPARVVALAKRAVDKASGDANIVNTLAAALYRAGQYQASVEAYKASARLRKAPNPVTDVYENYQLALVYHQLGNFEEARDRLARALRAHDHISTEQPPPGSNQVTFWHQRLEWRLLRQEALALIQGK
jgi:WD40 repeat protein/tRNA A-37 threonylcarbamoyl transferase component Bud32